MRPGSESIQHRPKRKQSGIMKNTQDEQDYKNVVENTAFKKS